MARKPKDLIILGRKIGTHTGWDQMTDTAIVFYDFVPLEGSLYLTFEGGDCLTYDYMDGTLTVSNEGGETLIEMDVVVVVFGLSKVTPV